MSVGTSFVNVLLNQIQFEYAFEVKLIQRVRFAT